MGYLRNYLILGGRLGGWCEGARRGNIKNETAYESDCGAIGETDGSCRDCGDRAESASQSADERVKVSCMSEVTIVRHKARPTIRGLEQGCSMLGCR